MLLALSTTNKIGLLVVGLVFIAFALASSFLFPRWNPEFPGRGLRAFLVVTVVLTIAMLGAVEVFAKEDEEEHEEPAAVETTQTETGPQDEATTETTTTSPETTTEPISGSPEDGKTVFASAGCGTCHTLAAAGSSGEIGPNLDEALKGKDVAFIRESIIDPNAEIAEGFQPGIMPADYSDKLTDAQLEDLVALLSESS